MKNVAPVPLVFRSIHWALAAIVTLNAFILPAGDEAHRVLGYFAVALVVGRLALWRRPRMHHLNPHALVVYGLIWLCVAFLGLTGWMSGLDAFWGNSTVHDTHAAASTVLTVLVVVHLLGIFLDSYQHRRKTWMRMLTG